MDGEGSSSARAEFGPDCGVTGLDEKAGFKTEQSK
jgi:hypothetical protein